MLQTTNKKFILSVPDRKVEDFQNHGYGPILLLAFWPLQAHSHSPLSPGVIRANSQHNTPASSEFAWNWAPMADDKDILSGIYSGILSGFLSDILFWHSVWHLF